MLSYENPFLLIEENDGEKTGIETKEEIVESDTYIFFSAIRTMLFDKIFRKDMTIEEKLTEVLSATEAYCDEEILIRDYENSIEAYKKTEPYNQLCFYLSIKIKICLFSVF